MAGDWIYMIEQLVFEVTAIPALYHRATIQTVIAGADRAGVRICAKGVETDGQWRQLRAMGVHLGQGWLFGRPYAPAGTAPLVGSTAWPVPD